MSVTLKVDHREGKLKELFAKFSVQNVSYENLEHGDFQILVNNDIKFIFERKTIEDLLASIKDGRYNNQKARLLELYQPSQLFYIIEGDVKWLESSSTTEKIVQSAIINTTIRDKIATFHTKSLSETFDLLRGIYSRIAEDPNKYLNGNDNLSVQTTVITNKEATSQQVFKAILCQVPGVSNKTATGLQERWQTLHHFYQELHGLPSDERLQHLNAIKIKNRKLSKKVVDGLLQHLLQ